MAEEVNWGRSYKIVFGTPEFKTEEYTYEGSGVLSREFIPKIEVDIVTTPSNAVSMSNLVSKGDKKRGFTFTMDSTRKVSSSSGTEKTTIQLYNLNEDSLEVLNQDGCLIRVFAGYGENLELAYSGDIKEVSPIKIGSDMVQRIKCGEGDVGVKNTQGTLDYAESVSEMDVILDLASRFPDTSVGFTDLSVQETIFTTGGQSFTGQLVKTFDKVIRRNDLQYGRFNGKIVILPYDLQQGSENFNNLFNNTFVLNSSNVKSITPANKNGKKKTLEKKTKQTMSINTFFIPIELGQFVEIDNETSEAYAGTYLVTGIRTVLQSKGSAWDVVITGEPI